MNVKMIRIEKTVTFVFWRLHHIYVKHLKKREQPVNVRQYAHLKNVNYLKEKKLEPANKSQVFILNYLKINNKYINPLP